MTNTIAAALSYARHLKLSSLLLTEDTGQVETSKEITMNIDELHTELHKLQDAAQQIDMSNPHAESMIEYLEDCISEVQLDIDNWNNEVMA